jgi:electron transfer flavoprotein beta subunit
MQIVVVLKMVPDVVEDIEIDPGGAELDADLLRMILSESDDCALEQALILKERNGAKVSAIALEAPEADDALFVALAKGADRAIRLAAGPQPHTTREAASMLAQTIAAKPDLLSAELVLTGVQAIDDLDGLLAPLIADHLGRPYLGIVTRLEVSHSGDTVVAIKEYPGGYRGEFEVSLPAVLGIQAAERPPRYVPVAKVRAVRKSQAIESLPAPDCPVGCSMTHILEMRKAETGAAAHMLEGSPKEVSGRLCEVLAERGLL